MQSTFHYKLSRTQWGIFIWITAEAVPLSDYSHHGVIGVLPKLRLANEVKLILSLEEFNYLAKGLQLVADKVREKTPDDLDLVIRIIDLEFDITDFQPEGLACAMAGWLGQAFGFTFEHPPVYFDHEKNRYIFTFPKI